MTLYVDADGCPVTDIAAAEGRKRGIPVVIVADTAHSFARDGAICVTVDQGADSADFYIANRLCAGDLVITQDFGLAAMCLARGAFALRQDGLFYTADNIDALLSSRAEAGRIRRGGGRLKGPKKRTPADDAAFVAALCAVLA